MDEDLISRDLQKVVALTHHPHLKILRLQEVIASIECTNEEEPTAGVFDHLLDRMFFLSTEKATPKRQKRSMPWYWVSEALSRETVPGHMTSKDSSK